MKAGNLTISVPNKGCDKNCDYCISKLTPEVDGNWGKMKENIDKVKKLADRADVTNVLVTGKGEPMLNLTDTCRILEAFKEYPTELQTNGKYLSENPEALKALRREGLNVLAVSIDAPFSQLNRYKNMFKEARKLGMLVRVCINVTDDLDFSGKVPKDQAWARLWEEVKKVEVDQFLLRNITLPHNLRPDAPAYTVQWINMHGGDFARTYDKMRNEMIRMCTKYGSFLRHEEVWGMKFYELDGISVSYSDYCIQEQCKSNEIRSLIFMPDGHLYTSWNNTASKLF